MIIDASVAFKLIVNEPDSEAAIALISRGELTAPSLVLAEVGNALWKRVVRGELADDGEIADRLADLERYIRIVDETPLVPQALRLAIDLRYPLYDCLYLALAEASDEELVTVDERFLGALGRTPYSSRVKRLQT